VNTYTDNTDIQDQNVKSPCKALATARNRKIDKQVRHMSVAWNIKGQKFYFVGNFWGTACATEFV
jgi:hypothetical protein